MGLNILSYKIYCKLINPLTKEFNYALDEWVEAEKNHNELNGKLEELFKIAEEKNGLTKEQWNYYFDLRSENDVINSKMKMASVRTNDSNIKIQRITQVFMNSSKEIEIVYDGINKIIGRIKYKIRRKDAI